MLLTLPFFPYHLFVPHTVYLLLSSLTEYVNEGRDPICYIYSFFPTPTRMPQLLKIFAVFEGRVYWLEFSRGKESISKRKYKHTHTWIYQVGIQAPRWESPVAVCWKARRSTSSSVQESGNCRIRVIKDAAPVWDWRPWSSLDGESPVRTHIERLKKLESSVHRRWQ